MRGKDTAVRTSLFTVLTCCVGIRIPAIAQTAQCPTAQVPAAISTHGTITEGNATGTFERTIDLRTGFSKTLRNSGVQQSQAGFNGTAWEYANGIPSIVDVPPLMPDSSARAFVTRLGWSDPRVKPSRITRAAGTLERTYDLPRMSRITVISRSDDLMRPLEVKVDADWGIETTTFSDWRCAGSVNYPFYQTNTDPTGETQITRVTSVEPAQPTPDAFSVPPPQAHGHVGASGAAAFHYIGKRDRHIVVDAAINGREVSLIFDTGGANYFGPEAAQRMGLSVSGGMSISGIGSGSTAGGFTRIEAMTIANATLNDEVAVVAPLPWPESAAAPAGSAGFEFFGEFRTTIDFPNRTIAFSNFTDPVPAGGMRIPLTTDGHLPVIQATVNGIQGWFGVDTGDSTGITLFQRFARRAGVSADPALRQTTAGGVGGSAHLTHSRLRLFSIGGMDVANARVLLSDATAGAFASKGLAGNLGNGLFHCFRMTLDYQARALLLYAVPSTATCLQQLS